jgi:hypothetical protein
MPNEEKNKATPRERALAQIETTKRVIEKAKVKLGKQKADVAETEQRITDLNARLTYEQQHPALTDDDREQFGEDPDDDPDGPEPDDDSPIDEDAFVEDDDDAGNARA